MSEFLGTPGPWTYHKGGFNIPDPASVGDQSGSVRSAPTFEGGNGYWVAAIERVWPEEATEANARLIAAAPELLEVLRAYERWEANLIESGEAWAGSGMDGYPHLTSHLWDELLVIQAKRNDAIKKALG